MGVVTLGPQVREGETVFGVAHIFASFNDTFVHVTDVSGRETIARVTGGMKVKLIVMKLLPTLLCWPLRMLPRNANCWVSLPCTSSSAPPVVTAPRPQDPVPSPLCALLLVRECRLAALKMSPPFPQTPLAGREVAVVVVCNKKLMIKAIIHPTTTSLWGPPGRLLFIMSLFSCTSSQ